MGLTRQIFCVSKSCPLTAMTVSVTLLASYLLIAPENAVGADEGYRHAPNALGIERSTEYHPRGVIPGVKILAMSDAITKGFAKSKLLAGMIIKKIGGVSVRTPRALDKELQKLNPGDSVDVYVTTEDKVVGKMTIACIDTAEANRAMLDAKQAEMNRVYKLRDGRQMTLKQIEDHNKPITARITRLGASVASADFQEGQNLFAAAQVFANLTAVYLTKQGGREGLMAATQQALPFSRDIERLMGECGEAIKTCNDGTAITNEEIWEAALLAVAQAK